MLVCRCLADSPYADVCFLVHGVPMPAHRVILTARSSYFAHMFMSKWRDRPLIELKHKLVRPSETLIVLEHLVSVISLIYLFHGHVVTGDQYLCQVWDTVMTLLPRACNTVLVDFALVCFNLRRRSRWRPDWLFGVRLICRSPSDSLYFPRMILVKETSKCEGKETKRGSGQG